MISIDDVITQQNRSFWKLRFFFFQNRLSRSAFYSFRRRIPGLRAILHLPTCRLRNAKRGPVCKAAEPRLDQKRYREIRERCMQNKNPFTRTVKGLQKYARLQYNQLLVIWKISFPYPTDGRFPGLQIITHGRLPGFTPVDQWPRISCLQWRDRTGIAPVSLLTPPCFRKGWAPAARNIRLSDAIIAHGCCLSRGRKWNCRLSEFFLDSFGIDSYNLLS